MPLLDGKDRNLIIIGNETCILGFSISGAEHLQSCEPFPAGRHKLAPWGGSKAASGFKNWVGLGTTKAKAQSNDIPNLINPASKSESAGIWAQVQEVEGSVGEFLERPCSSFSSAQ